MRQFLFSAAALLLLSAPNLAAAAKLQEVATIPISGRPMKVFGAIIADPAIHRVFLADRSNSSIDVIDADTNKFLSQIGGFVGVRQSSSVSGPQGLVTVNEGRQLWATDGDSTVKVIDLANNQIVDTIVTGGKKRTGELVYDPVDHVVLVTNPDEKPQFLSLISTEPGHGVLARIPIPEATEGIERSVFFAPTDRFYVPIPSVDKQRSAGAVAEIDPRLGKLVALHPTPGCNPHSVQAVARGYLLLGCNFGPASALGPKGQLISFGLTDNRVIRTGPGLGGDGQTALDPDLGQYYAAANKAPGGPVLRVISLASFAAVQSIPTWDGSHSVALDEATHRLYLPAAAGAGAAPCGGCVVVYAPVK